MGRQNSSSQDLNHDGYPDMVMETTDGTGKVMVWYMGGMLGNQPQSSSVIGSAAGWAAVGLADMDGDGHPDIVWQNPSTRQVAVWYLTGTGGDQFHQFGWISSGNEPGWTVKGVIDLDGNGVPDVIWQYDSTGQVAAWHLLHSYPDLTFEDFAWIQSQNMVGWNVIVPLPPPPGGGGKPTVIQPSLPAGVPPGTQQIFTFGFSDPNGAGSIQTVKVTLTTSLGALPACTITYQTSGFVLNSNSDGQDGFLGPIASSSGQSLSNSSCTVKNPSLSTNGTQMTLTLPITFSTSFPQAANVYEYVADVNGLNSGWVYSGQWDPPQGAVGNCDTLSHGGVNNNPNDPGAYAGYYSNVYRLNGNEVYMYSYSSVSGPNAGLIIMHIVTYAYQNGTLIATNSGDSSTYGGTINANTTQTLYLNGMYHLGAYQLGSAANGQNQNDHWGTSPICVQLGYPTSPFSSNHFYDSSNTYVASKPTIVGPNQSTSAGIWYLGGAASINGYNTQVTLYGDKNWIGTANFLWSVIQRPDKIVLSASVANQNVVTSAGANQSTVYQNYDYDVLVQGSTDGLPTDPFPISVNAPWSVLALNTANTQYIDGNGNPQQGYDSAYQYFLYDVAGFLIGVPITLHETLENCVPNSPFDQQGNQTSWCTTAVPAGGDTWFPPGPLPAGWSGTAGHMWNGDGTWTDHYQVWGIAQYPTPQVPPESLGNTAVVNSTQKFFIGAPGDPNESLNLFTGICVENNKIQAYLDHGERQNVTSPVSTTTTIAGVPPYVCTQGYFVNR